MTLRSKGYLAPPRNRPDPKNDSAAAVRAPGVGMRRGDDHAFDPPTNILSPSPLQTFLGRKTFVRGLNSLIYKESSADRSPLSGALAPKRPHLRAHGVGMRRGDDHAFHPPTNILSPSPLRDFFVYASEGRLATRSRVAGVRRHMQPVVLADCELKLVEIRTLLAENGGQSPFPTRQPSGPVPPLTDRSNH